MEPLPVATQLSLQGEVRALDSIASFLLDEELYGSAWVVCGPLLCRSKALAGSRPGAGGSDLYCRALSFCGEALEGMGEGKRASMYYRYGARQRDLKISLRQHQQHADPDAIAAAAAVAGLVRDRQRLAVHARDLTEPYLKYKACMSLSHSPQRGAAVRGYSASTADLESIPRDQRSAAMSICLGVNHERLGLKRNAISAYMESLSACPLALEVVEPLLKLGVSPEEIWKKISSPSSSDGAAMRGSGGPSFLSFLPWLPLWFRGTAEGVEGRALALQHWSDMDRLYPDCHVVLLGLGESHMAQERWDDASFAFDQARKIDHLCLDRMDLYASVLRRQENLSVLNRLAHELLSVDAKRPEAWIAASLYSESRGNQIQALDFANKAIELDAKYTLGHTLKGSLLLSQGKPEHAISSYFQAHAIRKDIYTYRGLVDSYIACHKYQEATFAAKEAFISMPKSSQALTLYGRVLCCNADSVKENKRREKWAKAEKHFLEALRLDPGASAPSLALADLYYDSARYEQCVELITTTIEKHGLNAPGHDVLLTKVGQAYKAMGNLNEAMNSFLRAANSNPDNTDAAKGIEQVESLMVEA